MNRPEDIMANYRKAGPRSSFGIWWDDLQPGFACGSYNRDGEGIGHIRPMNVSVGGHITCRSANSCRKRKLSGARLVRAGDVIFNNTNSPELVGKTAPIRFRSHGRSPIT